MGTWLAGSFNEMTYIEYIIVLPRFGIENELKQIVTGVDIFIDEEFITSSFAENGVFKILIQRQGMVVKVEPISIIGWASMRIGVYGHNGM